MRLRPLLLPKQVRQAYRTLESRNTVKRLGSMAELGIGYVSGANDFFHLRPSQAKALGISEEHLKVAVRSNRDLGELTDVDEQVVDRWLSEDRPVLLLDLTNSEHPPDPVLRYLDSPAGHEAKKAFKCRVRTPWYVVPDVRPPDAFLSIMSTRTPRLVGNSARAVCTNSVHAVRFTNGSTIEACLQGWNGLLTVLSCEVEGHALGGGLLKLEPGEAREVLLGQRVRLSREHRGILELGIRELRGWRNVKEA